VVQPAHARRGPPPPLTHERVVAQALTVIAQEGVGALTMRTLAARLGVVPGALYRHVRNKEQLQDLVLDGVLAEVDCNLNRFLAWSEQLKVLAHRLRQVLEALRRRRAAAAQRGHFPPRLRGEHRLRTTCSGLTTAPDASGSAKWGGHGGTQPGRVHDSAILHGAVAREQISRELENALVQAQACSP
jgi:AcrR family transcriptional regulator